MRWLLAIVLLPSLCFSAWDKGFNFRATSGYVTDGSNETYVTEIENSYPVTRNGVTFGWGATSGGFSTRDRDAGTDRRLAGLAQIGNSINGITFTVDLPAAGQYDIQLSFGDFSNPKNNYITVKDGSTTLISFQPSNTSAQNFTDAAGVTYSDVNWPGSHATVRKTFATTTLNIELAGTAGADADPGTDTAITHLFISQVPPTGSITSTTGAGRITTTSGTGRISAF